MTGELDLRTPIPQTEEYYSALKMLKVPVVMLRFNGEYHGTSSKPSNFLRTQLYMLSWYQQHRLGSENAASTSSEARQPYGRRSGRSDIIQARRSSLYARRLRA